MMKKLLVGLLSLIMTFSCAFVSGCNLSEQNSNSPSQSENSETNSGSLDNSSPDGSLSSDDTDNGGNWTDEIPLD